MPLTERLRSFLDSQHAEYTVSVHPKAFTAREVAFAEHLPASLKFHSEAFAAKPAKLSGK